MTTDSSSSTLTEEQAARLQRLAARRGAQAPRQSPEAPSSDRDRSERLERLTASRSRPAGGSTSGSGRKRRHPAKGSRLTALALSVVTTSGLTVVFAANSVGAGLAQPSAVVAAAPPLSNTTGASNPTTVSSTTAAAIPAVVTGDAISNRFGTVQVQATFAADGSLADVAVLQAPNHDGRSARISQIAVPMLNNEALTVQSANVDTISGATYTSHSYEQSLQSAIDDARAQGMTSIA